MLNINIETTEVYKSIMGDVLPRQSTSGSAGIDMIASIQQPVILDGGGRWNNPYYCNIPTGIKLEIPEGYVGLAAPRSGLAYKHQTTLINGPGIIDSDYRGEIVGIMINHGPTPITINPGDRIFQLVIIPYPKVNLVYGELSNTNRGTKGFGSTGQ